MVNTWHLYYTVNPCGSGHSSTLSYVKNTDALKTYGTTMVSCGIDYNAYVTEFFINSMISYGLLDADIIYVNDILYTKRWICSTTGTCSQISSGYGYASEASCKGTFPCNPNQWKINTPTLTGTVSASGMYLAWSLTPKDGVTINFNFGSSVSSGTSMTPVIYTDSSGITQIGVYQSGTIWGSNHYAMNTSYHGGSADFYLQDSDVNIISQTPGYAWEMQYPKGAVIPPVVTCTPSYVGICRQPLNGYEYDINNCSGSVDRLNSNCNPGTGTGGAAPPVVGKTCKDPLKIGCIAGIPMTYIAGLGVIVFIVMKKSN
jgi:hypothetical protein